MPYLPPAMDPDPFATLNLRLADACRVEHHGLLLLEAISANAQLPGAVRDRAEIHRIETQAQWNQLLAALRRQAPGLADRIAATCIRPLPRRPGPSHWMELERREISAYQGVLAYCGHSRVDSLPHACAAAIDLQRSVLQWLEGEAAPSSTSGDGTGQRDPHVPAAPASPRTRRHAMPAWLDPMAMHGLGRPAAAGSE